MRDNVDQGMSRHVTLAHVDINVRVSPTTRCHLAPMLTNTTLIRNSLDTGRVTIMTTDQDLGNGTNVPGGRCDQRKVAGH